MTQIKNFLEYRGYYVQRLNAGRYPMGEGKDRRFVVGVRAGTPDLMAFKKKKSGDTHLLFVEVKAGRNVPTDLQDRVMTELEDHGAQCIVAYGYEDVEKVI